MNPQESTEQTTPKKPRYLRTATILSVVTLVSFAIYEWQMAFIIGFGYWTFAYVCCEMALSQYHMAKRKMLDALSMKYAAEQGNKLFQETLEEVTRKKREKFEKQAEKDALKKAHAEAGGRKAYKKAEKAKLKLAEG